MTAVINIRPCPLCGAAANVTVKRLPTASIEHYWRAIGYELRTVFPDFPASIAKQLCLNCDLRFFVPQMIGGADLYNALGRTSIYYDAFKWEFVEVLRLLAGRRPGSSFLEFGCGRGWFLEKAKPYFERAAGIDFNQDAVKDCRARGLDVSGGHLATMQGSHDVIASFQVLEHLANPGETLRHLVQLLRPGGQLIIAVPNEESLLGELEKNYLNLPPHHASCWTKRSFDHVADMFSMTLEQYLREPLDMPLYLAALHERMDRYLTARRGFMRLPLWLIRQAAVAFALTRIDFGRAESFGHTHIAVFRKAGLVGAGPS